MMRMNVPKVCVKLNKEVNRGKKGPRPTRNRFCLGIAKELQFGICKLWCKRGKGKIWSDRWKWKSFGGEQEFRAVVTSHCLSFSGSYCVVTGQGKKKKTFLLG